LIESTLSYVHAVAKKTDSVTIREDYEVEIRVRFLLEDYS